MLMVHQYEITERKEHLKSTNYELIKSTIDKALEIGLETWMLDMKFESDRASLIPCRNTINEEIRD